MLFNITNIEYRVRNISVLNKVSFDVEGGQSLLLLGPSGCGKTTLMNIMAGLLKANSGEVIFDGKDYATISELDMDNLRRNNFGFVFQKLHLINHLTVLQNIALSQTTPDHQKILELIEYLGLSGKENRHVSDLSVGEAQRVSIARAVVNNPRVIFADEPTSALDDVNTDKVMDLLFRQADKTNATVIAATHDARIKNRFETVLEMGT